VSNFTDVGRFHRKFRVEHLDDGPPRALDVELLRFRIKFMLEELIEYCEAVGITLKCELSPDVEAWGKEQDLPKAFDALIDLVYVAMGTAHVHRFPWHEGWNEVQRANMGKERCGLNHIFQAGLHEDRCCHPIGDNGLHCDQPRVKHSVRGSSNDVLKPTGWKPPNIERVLNRWETRRDRK
jgi:phosphoribosyl-ATP pyrophosphohydrolase